MRRRWPNEMRSKSLFTRTNVTSNDCVGEKEIETKLFILGENCCFTTEYNFKSKTEQSAQNMNKRERTFNLKQQLTE